MPHLHIFVSHGDETDLPTPAFYLFEYLNSLNRTVALYDLTQDFETYFSKRNSNMLENETILILSKNEPSILSEFLSTYPVSVHEEDEEVDGEYAVLVHYALPYENFDEWISENKKNFQKIDGLRYLFWNLHTEEFNVEQYKALYRMFLSKQIPWGIIYLPTLTDSQNYVLRKIRTTKYSFSEAIYNKNEFDIIDKQHLLILFGIIQIKLSGQIYI